MTGRLFNFPVSFIMGWKIFVILVLSCALQYHHTNGRSISQNDGVRIFVPENYNDSPQSIRLTLSWFTTPRAKIGVIIDTTSSYPNSDDKPDSKIHTKPKIDGDKPGKRKPKVSKTVNEPKKNEKGFNDQPDQPETGYETSQPNRPAATPNSIEPNPPASTNAKKNKRKMPQKRKKRRKLKAEEEPKKPVVGEKPNQNKIENNSKTPKDDKNPNKSPPGDQSNQSIQPAVSDHETESLTPKSSNPSTQRRKPISAANVEPNTTEDDSKKLKDDIKPDQSPPEDISNQPIQTPTSVNKTERFTPESSKPSTPEGSKKRKKKQKRGKPTTGTKEKPNQTEALASNQSKPEDDSQKLDQSPPEDLSKQPIQSPTTANKTEALTPESSNSSTPEASKKPDHSPPGHQSNPPIQPAAATNKTEAVTSQNEDETKKKKDTDTEPGEDSKRRRRRSVNNTENDTNTSANNTSHDSASSSNLTIKESHTGNSSHEPYVSVSETKDGVAQINVTQVKNKVDKLENGTKVLITTIDLERINATDDGTVSVDESVFEQMTELTNSEELDEYYDYYCDEDDDDCSDEDDGNIELELSKYDLNITMHDSDSIKNNGSSVTDSISSTASAYLTDKATGTVAKATAQANTDDTIYSDDLDECESDEEYYCDSCEICDSCEEDDPTCT